MAQRLLGHPLNGSQYCFGHIEGERVTSRLIVGAYHYESHQLLGSCCSPPVRVLANNDVPTGAAYMCMQLPVSSSWEGWQPKVMAHVWVQSLMGLSTSLQSLKLIIE